MTGQSSNDNSLPKLMQDFPDAHGQAAILLVESLMHGLLAQSLITVAGALEVIEVALDVARNTEEELSDPAVSQLRASTLLQAMSKSLSHDLPKGARSD